MQLKLHVLFLFFQIKKMLKFENKIKK
jgi:hypothetical protein